ncbi:MAG: transposase, partial [Saprospiraceae bacterium]
MMIGSTIIKMRYEEQEELIKEQSQEIAELKAMVQSLMLRISELEHNKNSKNSATRPSEDPNRKKHIKSLREKSDKKPGGQLGHKGHTKKMIDTPNEIIDHKPQYCEHCSHPLSGKIELARRKQVVDIPPIEVICTEHSVYSGICACCQKKTTSPFPEGVKGNVSYGPNIEALTLYMNVRQYMPYEGMQELFRQVFHVDISQGRLVNFIKRAALKAAPVYEHIHIKLLIEQSKCVGSDETGCAVNGQRHWYWTWQNEEMTYIVASPTRGFATVEQELPRGLPNTILVSDCLAPQLKQSCKAHQICIAHLYRDLNFLIEKEM